MFGSIGFTELLLVFLVLSILGFPLIAGFCMWMHYLLIKSPRSEQKTASPAASPGTTSSSTTLRIGEGLPVLRPGQRLAMEFIRDPMQRVYLPFVLLPSVVLAIALVAIAVSDTLAAAGVALGLGILTLAFWISWRLLYVYVLGHSIRVSETQYPQLYRLIEEASNILGIKTPTTFIMQGHGLFETLVAKRFSKKGLIIVTSNLVDDLAERGASRELMFFIGRQLGLMATGYFRFWFTKGILGRIALPFYLAWERRCQITADRIGLLVAGELHAAEQALVVITAGSAVAPSTSCFCPTLLQSNS
jgi:Zn-dependent protease with chaperone function